MFLFQPYTFKKNRVYPFRLNQYRAVTQARGRGDLLLQLTLARLSRVVINTTGYVYTSDRQTEYFRFHVSRVGLESVTPPVYGGPQLIKMM